MSAQSPVVVPSSLKMHTGLVPLLIERNPSLAQQVVNALNCLDRGRSVLYHQVLGWLPTDLRPL